MTHEEAMRLARKAWVDVWIASSPDASTAHTNIEAEGAMCKAYLAAMRDAQRAGAKAMSDFSVGDRVMFIGTVLENDRSEVPYCVLPDDTEGPLWLCRDQLHSVKAPNPLTDAERRVVEAMVKWQDPNPSVPIASYSASFREAILATDAVIKMRKPPDPIADLIQEAREAARQLDGLGCAAGASLLRESAAAAEKARGV